MNLLRATDDLLRLTATHLGGSPTREDIREFAALLNEQARQLLDIIDVKEEQAQARAA